MGRADGAPVSAADGGAIVLAPFLARRARIAPLHNRLVVFRSDTVLHEVVPWTGASPRLAASFWFDSSLVNRPEELELTRDRLAFPSWDDAAAFFQTSPLQRCVSRAVYPLRRPKSDREDRGSRVAAPPRPRLDSRPRGRPLRYDEDYSRSIRATMRGGKGEAELLAGHRRVVAATQSQLKPLVDELRRRRDGVGPDLIL